MDRKFERRGMPHGDRMVSSQIIACGVEGCGEEFIVPDTGRIPLPPDAVSSKARRAGWKVGRGASRDRCPTHAKHTREKTVEMNRPNLGASLIPPEVREVLDTHTIDKRGVVTLRAAPGL